MCGSGYFGQYSRGDDFLFYRKKRWNGTCFKNDDRAIAPIHCSQKNDTKIWLIGDVALVGANFGRYYCSIWRSDGIAIYTCDGLDGDREVFAVFFFGRNYIGFFGKMIGGVIRDWGIGESGVVSRDSRFVN